MTVFALWLGWFTRPNPFPDAFPNPTKQIQKVEMTISQRPLGTVELRVTDSSKIRLLLTEPLRRAQLDSQPHTMTPFCWLHIFYDDGSSEGAILFAPWGHFEFGDKYGTANLAAFREECQNLLRQSADPAATTILNQPQLWR
jgi:hypothetical protein